MKQASLFILVLACCNAVFPAAEDQDFRFHHISLEEGLSHSLVNSCAEDDLGFLWFGTQDGLNRYDGTDFRVYHAGNSRYTPSRNWIKDLYIDNHNQVWIFYQATGLERFDPYNEVFHTYEPDTAARGSISSNTYFTSYSINYEVFFEDSEGTLWIGTDRGLNRYIREEDRFVSYMHDPDDPNSLSDNRIIIMNEDAGGHLWIGTHNGLNRLNKETGSIKRFFPDPGHHSAQDNYTITDICVCENNLIWAGTFFGGLHILEPAADDEYSVTYLIDEPLDKNLEPTVEVIYPVSSGHMLVGTEHGLYKVEKTEGGYQPGLYPETRNINISFILEDPEGRIWLGAGANISNSLFLMEPDHQSISNFSFHDQDPYSFTGGNIHFMEISRTELLWIGVEKNGIFKVDLNAKKFHTINEIPTRSLYLTDNEVYAIHQDRRNQLYVGTKDGLNQLDLNTGEVHDFRNERILKNGITYEYSDKLPAKTIGTIAETPDGKLWMGSFDYKLSLYDPAKERFLNFHQNEDDPGSFRMWSMRTICVTSDGQTYFGGTQNGLCTLSEDGHSFSYFPVVSTGDPDGTNDYWISHIIEDRNGMLWLGTYRGGLNRYDPEKDQFTHFVHDPGDNTTISSNLVKCILEPVVYPGIDGEDILWVGTNGGLNRFDRQSGTFELFGVERGMPGNTIHGILEDKLGRLWISTNQGLVVFDAITENFRVYTVEDGLQGNEFNEGSYFKSDDGTLYFGGTNGITYFNPDEISDNPVPSRTVITDFRIHNRSVIPNQPVNDRIILEQSIMHTDEIFLTRKDRVISFEFTSLNFVAPTKLKYRYMLEGFEDIWTTVPSDQRFASYTNIPSGDYTLKIMSQNSDGLWAAEPTTLEIHVMPPFWERYWFRLLIVLAIMLIFVLVIRIRTGLLKNQKKMLALQVEERTMDLREANRMLEEKQKEIVAQSEKLASQRDNLSQQNKLLEEQKFEIQKMAEKLHESDEMKLRFFTNISHEIRTPLTLIMGPTETLLKMPKYSDTERIKEDLTLIYRNEKRLFRLINQLLEMRRIETGSMRLKVQEADIIEFLDGIYKLFIPLADRQNIHFDFEHREESLLAFFDADKVEKILYNLLSNAMKHSHSGGQVILSLEVHERGGSQKAIHISVRDKGEGIPPQHLPHVFDRFYQAGNQSSENISTGIGLSLCKELAEKHHGTITVESEPGKGSSFSVLLPADAASYTEDERRTAEDPEHQLSYSRTMISTEEERQPVTQTLSQIDEDQFRILVVEDNNDMQQFLNNELSKHYKVVVARNGLEGLNLAREIPPDLIICDIMMPEMDGLELCHELKNSELTSHIPVFLLTAKSETEYQVSGFESGADDYITKPFSIEVLQLKIKNLLESRKQIAEHFSGNAHYIPENIQLSQIDQGFLERFVDLVEKNIDDPELSGDRLARELGMSKGNLYKKLKTLTGMTVNVYVRTIRLKVAARILKKGRYNISEVAYSVGFDNPKYFSTCFSDLFSMSPKEYMGTTA